MELGQGSPVDPGPCVGKQLCPGSLRPSSPPKGTVAWKLQEEFDITFPCLFFLQEEKCVP